MHLPWIFTFILLQKVSSIKSHKRKSIIRICILDITQSCTWWWGYSAEDQSSVKYSFIDITLRFTLNKSGKTC